MSVTKDEIRRNLRAVETAIKDYEQAIESKVSGKVYIIIEVDFLNLLIVDFGCSGGAGNIPKKVVETVDSATLSVRLHSDYDGALCK